MADQNLRLMVGPNSRKRVCVAVADQMTKQSVPRACARLDSGCSRAEAVFAEELAVSLADYTAGLESCVIRGLVDRVIVDMAIADVMVADMESVGGPSERQRCNTLLQP